MSFKEWLKISEDGGTSTACIAAYPRAVIPNVRHLPDKLTSGKKKGGKKDGKVEHLP
jgi:hypothetical protein